MRISDRIKQSVQRALCRLREDRVTVIRKQRNGHLMEDQVIYEDVVCHLSAGSRSEQLRMPGRTGAAETEGDFLVYLPVELEVLPGDTLLITHCGQQVRGVAGLPFCSDFCLTIPLREWTVA